MWRKPANNNNNNNFIRNTPWKIFSGGVYCGAFRCVEWSSSALLDRQVALEKRGRRGRARRELSRYDICFPKKRCTLYSYNYEFLFEFATEKMSVVMLFNVFSSKYMYVIYHNLIYIIYLYNIFYIQACIETSQNLFLWFKKTIFSCEPKELNCTSNNEYHRCALGGSGAQVRFEHRGLRVVFALHVVTSTWSRVTSTISRSIWACQSGWSCWIIWSCWCGKI